MVRQGDLAGARAQLENALRNHKSSAEPWISLAAVHGMGGDYKEALRCARKAVELAPNSLQAWVNLANAAASCAEPAQSIEAFKHARKLPGCPSDITLNLGLALAEQGRWAEAEEVLRAYIAAYPGHREATLTCSRALARQNKFEAAITMMEAYCKRHPDDAPALTQLGMTYLHTGQSEDASRVCDLAGERFPDTLDALYLKGSLSMFHGHYEEARDAFDRLLQLQSSPSPEFYILAAQACQQASTSSKTGVAYARAAVRLDPDNVIAIVTLSGLLVSSDLAEARQWMEKVRTIAPMHPLLNVLRGRILEHEGDKQGAWDSVRPLLEGNTVNNAAAASIAADVAPAIGNTDEVITLLEKLVEHPGNSMAEVRGLHFKLAGLCDKAGRYERAFEHAVIANRLKNAWYDHDSHKVDNERLMTVYAKNTVSALPRSRINSELPVFIVGMPRSGTSLLEQILSCHSQVHARGELTEIGTMAEKTPYYPDGVRNLRQEELDKLAETHLQRLREIAPTARRFTDKLPSNYAFLGLISQVFPGARIINCRRDPRDICLSQFMIEFNTGMAYSYNLESLAQVYQNYLGLMRHWKSVLPLPILDVRYEEVVADPHTTVSRVLEFCGLEWEDACLDFHRSKRRVATASYDQVKKPLYNSSVARWKHYRQQLEPVSRILGLHDDTYP